VQLWMPKITKDQYFNIRSTCEVAPRLLPQQRWLRPALICRLSTLQATPTPALTQSTSLSPSPPGTRTRLANTATAIKSKPGKSFFNRGKGVCFLIINQRKQPKFPARRRSHGGLLRAHDDDDGGGDYHHHHHHHLLLLLVLFQPSRHDLQCPDSHQVVPPACHGPGRACRGLQPIVRG